MITNPEIVSELHRLADANDGVLLPADVVNEAARETSPLHSWFQWNDGKAAHLYRLQQARQLLRVTVAYDTQVSAEPVRVFVSLSTDRKEGGYRSVSSVLADDASRQQMLDDAIEEMRRFRAKFNTLKELVSVFSAMRESERFIISEVIQEAVA